MFGGDFVKIKLVGDTFDAFKMPQLITAKKAAFIILLMILRLLKDKQL